MLTNNKIDGILQLKYSSMDNESTYKYDISSKVSLKRFLEGKLDKNKLLKILLSILNTFDEIDDYMLLKEHLILDENYVYVDVSNYSLHFVCLPIDHDNNVFNINEFIKMIIYSADGDVLDGINHISSLYKALDSKELDDVRQIVNIIKLQADKNDSKIINICGSENAEKAMKIEATDNIYSISQNRNIKKIDSSNINKTENVDFFIPNITVKDKGVGKTNVKTENKLKDIFKLAMPKKKENLHLIRSEEKTNDNLDNNTVLISNSKNIDETCLLQALTSGLYPVNPYLVRKQNDEKIFINSDLFRIGTETDYVDYAIKDNITISRAHADIIKINKDYYIQDNNSKNHTYVNDKMICDGQAIKLEHNFEIKLSDERFVFRLY